jgi:hypothetical protein
MDRTDLSEATYKGLLESKNKAIGDSLYSMATPKDDEIRRWFPKRGNHVQHGREA